jgi:hypothetical protein
VQVSLYCTLLLPEEIEEIDVEGYQVELLVEDVTRADAAAPVVGQIHTDAKSLQRIGRRLGPIAFSVTLPRASAAYNVRGILSRGRALASGDMLSTRSIPLSSSAREAECEIPLTRVK